MAGENDLLTRITASIAALDDAAWEALASKGLLRRARKELEKLPAPVVCQKSDAIEIELPPVTVLIPATGPAKAACSYPSPGVCQHIIVACLWLLSNSGNSAKREISPESIRNELAEFTSEVLRKWGGSADYRAAETLIEKNGLPAVLEYSEVLLIRLMPSCLEVRYVPGAGLDGMIFPVGHGRRAGIAALLAARQALGLESARITQAALIDTSGAPRSSNEVLASVRAVLSNAVASGLSHVSASEAERLTTLSISAQAANLPRLALALRAIADEIRALDVRNARADESRLLLLAARAAALSEALARVDDSVRPDLVGVARAQYVEVPEMELFGVGAYTWQSGSGFAGLTVLLWSNTTKAFLSWSEARPVAQRFDPRQRFFGEGPWDGTQSPQQVASSRLKLRKARRTMQGRLSGSKRSSALVLRATDLADLDFADRRFDAWDKLRDHYQQNAPIGLRDPNPLDLMVVLQPSKVSEPEFDHIEQRLVWKLFDNSGRPLELVLPFRENTENAIRRIEEISGSLQQNCTIITRLLPDEGGFLAEPISLLQQSHSVLQLGFDSSVAPAMSVVPTPENEKEQETEIESSFEAEDSLQCFEGGMSRVVNDTLRCLESIAEAGTIDGVERYHGQLTMLVSQLRRSGFIVLARSLEALATNTANRAGQLLTARFLLHLHEQAAAQCG